MWILAQVSPCFGGHNMLYFRPIYAFSHKCFNLSIEEMPMRNAGRLILGFYPLPKDEARRLRRYLRLPNSQFSALDPCVGDGVAFHTLLEGSQCQRYGIELDALRAEETQNRGISVIHGDALEVRCPAESVSLLYLNPPYDFEVGSFGNRRFEELFLQHTCRWLKRGGVLLFIIPQRQLARCSKLLAEYFTAIRVYRLTSPEYVQYNQVAVLASRRTTRQTQTDRQQCAIVDHLESLATNGEGIALLGEKPDARYEVPASGPLILTNRGLPLDELEDLLPRSTAYQQATRLLVRQPSILRGRPITQLHGGHVALLAASGALNGVFGESADRHMANWSPSKMHHHSVQREEDGTVINRKWSSFSPKLLLLYQDGRTKVLTHQKSKLEAEDDGQHEFPPMALAQAEADRPPDSSEEAPVEATSSAPSPRRTVRRRINLKK